jgi:hypothetical protein
MFPCRRASFQTSRRTSSSASVASCTTWNGSDAPDWLWAALSDRPGDPGGHVTRHEFDLFAALLAERVKAREHGPAVPAGGGPHQPAGVMVNHDGQVSLAFAMADLAGTHVTSFRSATKKLVHRNI